MATQLATTQPKLAFNSNATATGSKSAISQSSDRVRPYKDFLTPALHRRFTRSALVLLAFCFLESLLIGPPKTFWSLTPIAAVNARTLLLLGPCLAVFIVRVANIHIGERTSTSSAATAYNALKSLRTLHTLVWYCWSAWFFGELYIWSRGSDDHLLWVDPGMEYERPRLNENPIFLRCFLFSFGIAQTALHLIRDYDRVRIQDTQARSNPTGEKAQPVNLVDLISAGIPIIGRRTIVLILPMFALNLPLYFIFVRYLVWPYFHAIGRTLHRDLAPSDRPTGVGVDHVFQLIWQCLFSATLLIMLWESSNAVFEFNVSQPPLKREQPLTSEIKDAQGQYVSKSKDPNASLINGLKSKKGIVQGFAFCELWLICSDFEIRRKTIYSEVDRKDGSTWSQVSKICLSEIEAISLRISGVRNANNAGQKTEARVSQGHQDDNSTDPYTGQPFGMPSIADRKVLDENVWLSSRRPALTQSVGQAAKNLGQSPNRSNTLVPHARRALEWGRDHIMSKEEQERFSRQALGRDVSSFALQALQTPFGEPFQQKFANSLQAVIFGTPTSRRTIIIFAVKSLAKLTLCSLKEDDYAQVANSVPTIIRTFTSTINDIDSFTASFPPHWTDVNFTERDRGNVHEVREVLAVLRTGLEEVLLAFGEYASAIGLTKLELRQAQEALGKRVEMRQR